MVAPESHLTAAGELPECPDVVTKSVSGRILIMECAKNDHITTLMCDKNVFLTWKSFWKWRGRFKASDSSTRRRRDWLRCTRRRRVCFDRHAKKHVWVSLTNLSVWLAAMEKRNGACEGTVTRRRPRFPETLSDGWPQAGCIQGHRSKSESCTFTLKVLTNQGNEFYRSLSRVGRITALTEKCHIS